MGLVYDRLGKRDEAVKWFKKAFAAPVLSADDGETHKKVCTSFSVLSLPLTCRLISLESGIISGVGDAGEARNHADSVG